MVLDPTVQGLQIVADVANKHRDLFDFVQQHWQKRAGGEPVTDAVVAEFLEFSRELFRKNMPIGTDFLSAGLSLRFQDGSVLPFCDSPLPTGTDTGSISVSTKHRPHDGKTPMVPSPSWDISKPE